MHKRSLWNKARPFLVLGLFELFNLVMLITYHRTLLHAGKGGLFGWATLRYWPVTLFALVFVIGGTLALCSSAREQINRQRQPE